MKICTKSRLPAYAIYMLRIEKVKFHKVVAGQTAREIAAAYRVGLFALVQENELTEEVKEGQVLRLPKERGNSYVVQTGDSKKLLCGEQERYEKRNGKHLYPGMQVIL